MLTVDALRNLGADVDDGIRRCVNNEAFYLKMVGKTLPDLRTEELKDALAAEDWNRAFVICHTLTGVLANLSLTPALAPTKELTELLRPRTSVNFKPLLVRMDEEFGKLRALADL